MIGRAIARLVEISMRTALAVVIICLVGGVLLGAYAVTHLSVDTDTNDLISPELPWRKREAEFDRAFPQNVDLLAVVIDGATPGQAEDAATYLAQWMRDRPQLYRTVRRPDGGEFFTRNGLLFLPVKEVQDVADQLITAQPLLGSLAADPSLRGLFSAISLALQGVTNDEIKLAALDAPLTALADPVEAALAGRPHHLSWESLFTGRAPQTQERRRFILVQPNLDYSALEPGAKASTALRTAAEEFGLTPEHGVRVRLTGPVALSDEEFSTVAEGAGGATIMSFLLVCVILFLALRSWRIIVAILGTLLVGLAATAAFAAIAIGSLNLISVAFAVLFIGIAVDFSIQFSVRYRDERYQVGELGRAIDRAGHGIAGPLTLAATTTAVGFFSFVPTAYSGVSELGLIAGTSMVIALVLNFTLLPAALKLLHPPGESEPVGRRHRCVSVAPAPFRPRRHRRRGGSLYHAVAALALRFQPAQSQGSEDRIGGDIVRSHVRPFDDALHHRRAGALGHGGGCAGSSRRGIAGRRPGRHDFELYTRRSERKAGDPQRCGIAARPDAVAAGESAAA
jgi:uncharacterized protein